MSNQPTDWVAPSKEVSMTPYSPPKKKKVGERLLSFLKLFMILFIVPAVGATVLTTYFTSIPTCERVVQEDPIMGELPQGWTVQCVKELPDDAPVIEDLVIYGLTYSKEKTIYLKENVDPYTLADTLAHEIGHAYSSEYMSYNLMQDFAIDVGQRSWSNKDYENDAGEIWARGFAVCSGYKNRSGFPAAPCDIVEKYKDLIEEPYSPPEVG